MAAGAEPWPQEVRPGVTGSGGSAASSDATMARAAPSCLVSRTAGIIAYPLLLKVAMAEPVILVTGLAHLAASWPATQFPGGRPRLAWLPYEALPGGS